MTGAKIEQRFGFLLRAFDWVQNHPSTFFGLVSLLFFSPLFMGYAFLPLSYLALTPLWYDPTVVPGNYDLFDAIIYFAPMDEFLRQSLFKGQFPFWNPYNLGGHPAAFNGQTGFFYPPKLLLLYLFPTWLAHGVSLGLHSWLAGVSSYYLARRLGMGSAAGLLLGIAWQWNGYLAGCLEFNHFSTCAAWTPLVVLSALRARDCWRFVGLLAVSLAMLLVSSHLQILLNFLLFGTVSGLYLAGRWKAMQTVRFLLGVALGFGLATPYLGPSAVLMSSSQRPTMSSEFLLGSYRQFLASAPPATIFPEVYGSPADYFATTRISGAGTFIFVETCFYLGVIPLYFAILGGFSNRGGRFFFLAALITLVLPATPMYLPLSELPGLNRVISVRFVSLVQLLLVVAAGFGFHAWWDEREKDEKVFSRAHSVAKATLTGLAIWAVLKFLHGLSQGWQSVLGSGLLRLPDAGLFMTRESYLMAVKTGFEHCYSVTNSSFTLPLLSLIVLALVLPHRSSRWSALLLITATLVELTAFAYRQNPIEPSKSWFPSTSVTSYLSQNLGTERVAGLSTIKPNTLLPLSLRDAGGYDSFYPRDSAIFLSALRKERIDLSNLSAQVLTGEDLSAPLLDLMAVRYLVGIAGSPKPEGTTLVEQGILSIYRRGTALPRAYLCSEVRKVQEEEVLPLLSRPDFPRSRVALSTDKVEEFQKLDSGATGKARLILDTPNLVSVHVSSSGPQLLVLADAWCQGWEVTVNGLPQSLYRVNQMFRGVVIESGESQVVFKFHPPGWDTYVRIFIFSALLTLLALLLGGKLPWVAKTSR